MHGAAWFVCSSASWVHELSGSQRISNKLAAWHDIQWLVSPPDLSYCLGNVCSQLGIALKQKKEHIFFCSQYKTTSSSGVIFKTMFYKCRSKINPWYFLRINIPSQAGEKNIHGD